MPSSLWYNPFVGQQLVVFHIVNSLTVGGAEQFVVNMLRYHDRSRYFPVCICLRSPLGTHLETAVKQMGVPLYFLEVSNKPLRWIHNKNLNYLFNKYNPSIVHTHLSGIRYAYFLSIKHRTPVRVHTIHSVSHEEIGSGSNRWVRILAFKYRVGSFVPVAISEEVARTFQTIYGRPSPVIIPNGIPTEDFSCDLKQRIEIRRMLGAGDRTIVFIHVGRFAPVKNHELLVGAFATLCMQEQVPISLWLVGEGELRGAIQEKVQQLGIGHRVQFLGVRHDIPHLLCAADVFVFPSLWEGNPLSVMEAMAAGLPVIASRVGGIPELVEDGVSGILIPSENLQELTAAMRLLIRDERQRHRMSASARQRAVERFDMRHTVRAYEALYQSILHNRRLCWKHPPKTIEQSDRDMPSGDTAHLANS